MATRVYALLPAPLPICVCYCPGLHMHPHHPFLFCLYVYQLPVLHMHSKPVDASRNDVASLVMLWLCRLPPPAAGEHDLTSLVDRPPFIKHYMHET